MSTGAKIGITLGVAAVVGVSIFLIVKALKPAVPVSSKPTEVDTSVTITHAGIGKSILGAVGL